MAQRHYWAKKSWIFQAKWVLTKTTEIYISRVVWETATNEYLQQYDTTVVYAKRTATIMFTCDMTIGSSTFQSNAYYVGAVEYSQLCDGKTYHIPMHKISRLFNAVPDIIQCYMYDDCKICNSVEIKSMQINGLLERVIRYMTHESYRTRYVSIK